MTGRDGGSELRTAELVALLSLGTDLGMGQPMEHAQRTCLLGMRLADDLGLDDSERAVVYYVGLLAWVGCHADSFEMASMFGDDIAARAGAYEYEFVGLDLLRYGARYLGAGDHRSDERGRSGRSSCRAGAPWRSSTAPTARPRGTSRCGSGSDGRCATRCSTRSSAGTGRETRGRARRGARARRAHRAALRPHRRLVPARRGRGRDRGGEGAPRRAARSRSRRSLLRDRAGRSSRARRDAHVAGADRRRACAETDAVGERARLRPRGGRRLRRPQVTVLRGDTPAAWRRS